MRLDHIIAGALIALAYSKLIDALSSKAPMPMPSMPSMNSMMQGGKMPSMAPPNFAMPEMGGSSKHA